MRVLVHICYFVCFSMRFFLCIWSQNHRYNVYSFRFLDHASWQCSMNGLDETKYSIPESMEWSERTWKLVSTSIFSGSLEAGHYTAMTRDLESGSYTHYNDDFVSN